MVRPKQETVAEHIQRVRREGYRRPLRSLRELADDIGVAHRRLVGILSADKNAPKKKYQTGWNGSQRNTWFDPAEFMTWWRSREAKPD